MELFSVYEHPQDFPDHFAVRKMFVATDGLESVEWTLFATLYGAQSDLARRGLVRIPRGPADEPALVETWV